MKHEYIIDRFLSNPIVAKLNELAADFCIAFTTDLFLIDKCSEFTWGLCYALTEHNSCAWVSQRELQHLEILPQLGRCSPSYACNALRRMQQVIDTCKVMVYDQPADNALRVSDHTAQLQMLNTMLNISDDTRPIVYFTQDARLRKTVHEHFNRGGVCRVLVGWLDVRSHSLCFMPSDQPYQQAA